MDTEIKYRLKFDNGKHLWHIKEIKDQIIYLNRFGSNSHVDTCEIQVKDFDRSVIK